MSTACPTVTTRDVGVRPVMGWSLVGGDGRWEEKPAVTLFGYVPTGQPSSPKPFGLFGLRIVASMQCLSLIVQRSTSTGRI